MSQKYGLIVKEKKNSHVTRGRPVPTLVFAEGDDDEDLRAPHQGGMQHGSFTSKKLDQIISSDDIFDYDGSYETFSRGVGRKTTEITVMGSNEVENKAPVKSRYIESLKTAAAVRDREKERVYERKLLHEREADGVQEGLKFVTQAYREKLAQDKKLDYEDRLDELLEKRTGALSGGGMEAFYANLLTKNVAMGGDVAKNALSSRTAGSMRQERAAGAGACHTSGKGAVEVGESSASSGSSSSFGERGGTHVSAQALSHSIAEKQSASSASPNATSISSASNLAIAVDSARERYLARKRTLAQANGLHEPF
eukprot:gene32771-39618_t